MNAKAYPKLKRWMSGMGGALLSVSMLPALASNNVATLDVDNNLAVFSTTETKTSSLSCISIGNEQVWGSLLDESNSSYDFLAIAKRSQQPIEIISSGSCTNGIETTGQVNINYPYSDVLVPTVASNVNFVARTQVTMAEGEAAPTVQFELTGGPVSGLKTITVPDSAGLYLAHFGELAEGRYTLITRVTSSDASETVEQQAEFVVGHINIVDVYQLNGKLYVQLPKTHGSVYLELTPNQDGSYTVNVLDATTWNNLYGQFVVSNYQIDFGNFSGDTSQDFLLTSADGNTVLTFEQGSDGYAYVAPEQPITIQYVYDALGRLTDVIDATNGNRNYQYDEAGNRITAGSTQ
ncbi:RHS repeat domain-containing protein [Thalassotalea insulae]|nr:RHS repeat domain-containing protein [Thalassotalea insulae]